MKKIWYTNPERFLAAAVFSALAAVCVSLILKNFISDIGIYSFESSYEDSASASDEVINAFTSVAVQLENTRFTEGEAAGASNGIGGYRPEKLTKLPAASEWEYYIEVNGKVYANTEADYDDFLTSPLSCGTRHLAGFDGNEGFLRGSGNRGFITGILDSQKDSYKVAVRMPLAVIEKNTAEWNKLRDGAVRAMRIISVIIAVMLALLIYLLCVCGRKYGTDKIRMFFIDRMFVEFSVILLFGTLIFGAFGIACAVYEVSVGEYVPLMSRLAPLCAFVTAAVSLTALLSLVRNIKNRTFLERSIIAGFLKWISRKIKALYSSLRRLFGKKTGAIMAAMLAAYTVIAAINGFAAFAVLIIGWLFIGVRIRDFDFIRKGVREFKNGNFEYEINGCKCEDYKSIAEDLNDIGDGMSAAIEERVRAERLKSELITNVSHDLKTPLTSIINYADLLSKETLSPPEANDYAAIIKKKGERLKRLTNDLFDVSKAQSGSEEFDMEDIDLWLLVNQTLAELNEAIEKSGLKFIVKSSDNEVFVKADGAKMSRVFENLITNCLKYAMKNTRVYVDVTKTDAGAEVEIKNIAGYEMDFDAEEISERFVRGDKSRTSEGSGLGLAIAKAYVEGCGGSFGIRTDGDLFKVKIVFERAY